MNRTIDLSKPKSIWLLLMAMLIAASLHGQDVTFAGAGSCGAAAVSGSWTVPCGVTSITVAVYGAGGGAGGGGGGSNGGLFDTRGGGGGGGGGYTSTTINVTPGSSFTYSVGAGGCGGSNGSDASSGGNGNAGGNSSFSGTDAGGAPVGLTANGGARGTGGSGTEGSPGSGGAGGTASGGTTNTTGTAGNNGSGGNGGLGGAGAGPNGGAGGASTGAAGVIYGGGGAGGGNSQGGRGAAGGILITYGPTSGPSVTPIVNAVPATCSAAGTATITNYVASETYVFTPVGPTAGAGGAITGMTPGTSYTVVAGTGACASAPSTPFSVTAATGNVVDPIIASTPASCTANGSSVITTYNAANTYTFTPAGPTVGAGGAISGMTLGTSYTVTESDITCTSAPSTPFSNAAQLPAPTITITGTLTYCAGNNTTITANGGVSYIWDNVGNSITPSITVTQGTYNVGAIDANGCPGTASATVSESAPFAITITGALSHCIGGNTTITASGGSTYSWDDPANSATATVTLTQGNYTVTATDVAGCISTQTVTITESGTPVADFTVGNKCTGQALQFTDATTITTGTLTDWAWDFGDNTSSTLQNPMHTYTMAGTYDVTLTVSAGNCTDVITLQAISYPNPVAAFTTTDVCVGTAATFTDNSTITGATIIQWGWDFDGLGTAMQQSPSYTFASAGTYDVTLGVMTSDMCTDTHTEQIIVYPAPVPAFTAVAVCQGTTTTFQNQSTVNPGTISAQAWDFGDNIGTSLNASPTYTYATAGTYPVTLGVTTAFGCAAITTQNVTVNPLPTITASSTDILCAGQTNGAVTAGASGGSAPYTYRWNNPLQSTTASLQNLGPGAYTVTVTDGAGCVSDTTVIVIEPLPIIVNLIAAPDTCGNGNGAVQAAMIGGTAPFIFNWSSINDSASIFSTSIPAAGWNTMLSSGDYSVVVTDAGGCTTSGSTSVGLIASPIAAFTTRSKPEELIDPSVQFINQSQAAVTYEWHFGDGDFSYLEDPKHFYDTSGVFLVMLIAYNDPIYGCADTAFGYVEVDPLFTFYIPNAFTPDDDGKNDTWGPKGDNFEYESYNVQIFDRWGKLLWQTDNPAVEWDGRVQKSLEPVKQGIYIYQFILKKYNTFEPKKITGSIMVYRHN